MLMTETFKNEAYRIELATVLLVKHKMKMLINDFDDDDDGDVVDELHQE
jgi:hypothetical protein